MALGPVTMFLPKPAGISFADGMNNIRMFLDHKKLKPSGFKITAEDRIGFEISFSTASDAQAFELFAWQPC